MRHLLILIIVFSSLLSAPTQHLCAQDEDPAYLILDEDDEQKVKATVRTKKKKEEVPVSNQEEVVATPRPEDVLVAIVNSHVLTRAEINARISYRYEDIKEKVQQTHGGVLTNIDANQNFDPKQMDLDDKMLLEEQEKELQKAIRREENKATKEWVSQMILADEARRQRIIVTEREFRDRLAEAEKESRLEKSTIDKVLAATKMTRGDYERSVYEALLIEKMLKKFIELNYTLDYLKSRYDERPELYYEPRKFYLAHFAIVLNDNLSKDEYKALEEKAKEVKKRLSKGEEPRQIFDDKHLCDITNGIWGSEPSWYKIGSSTLRPIVEDRLKKMKTGETSDVLKQKGRISGEIKTISLHVIKLLEVKEPSGKTFESALPRIETLMLEVAKRRILAKLKDAKTHKVITNLSGIPNKKIPSRKELMLFESQADPINLKFPESRLEKLSEGN